ncbi:MAG TPA: hypothetical protein VHE35_25785 [Kofleriaceae bacterium]|nr:hypothetical protein [Kofleriaceae bacterium]
MARIRIVDEWLRSPASPPTYYRSIMVVAERWAEQRVLMRAYADSADQTRPTIVLHGAELAIGPAGLDPNGPWGIHVQPPADGRAQALKDALELASRRMAGSKGNAPRLEDEGSDFDRKRTNNWAPGAPRDVPDHRIPGPGWEPAVAASLHATASASAMQAAIPVPQHQTAAYVPVAPAAEVVPRGAMAADAALAMAPPVNPGERRTPLPVRRGLEEHRRRAAANARTQLGFTSGAGAQSAIIRLGLRPAVAARLARLVDRTVPPDFQISQLERGVLNALGERDRLSARAIGELVGVVDGVAWMEALVDKLERYGLDLVGPGEASGSEPTYVLRTS